MNFGKIFWGLGFILLAVALILNALGVVASFTSAVGEVSIIALVAAFIFLSYAISRIIKGKIGEIFVPLSFVFMLFEKNIAHIYALEDADIINNWLLFGCACLLQLGFSILFPSWNFKFKASKSDKGKLGWSRSRLSSTVKYIDAETFGEEWIENDIGSCIIRFENAEKYTGGGTLHVENNIGSMVIEVPSSWRYIHNIENSLGSVTATADEGNPDGPLLKIVGENNLGPMSIKFV